MANIPGEALTKVTLNLFTADHALLKDLFGNGWSVQIRDWVHERCEVVRKRSEKVMEDTNGRKRNM